MSEGNGLPVGWTMTTLGSICSKPQYGWTTKANHTSGSVQLLRTTDISKGWINWDAVPFCSEAPEPLHPYLLEAGDIVISRAGSVGLSFLLRSVPVEAVFASYLIRFRANHSVEARYLAYFLKSPDYWSAISEQSAGIAMANVNARKLEGIQVPLAPLAEQRRIVDAIEEQFARLDAGVAALERARANLKRYRASVLKAAVEGRLTEEWREQNPDAESGSALLERILEERRTRWEEAQLAKYAEAGKTPPKGWQSKYKEPIMPNGPASLELSDRWCWATVAQVSQSVRYGSSAKTSVDSSGVPVLRMGNIQDGTLNLGNLKYLPRDHAEFPDLLLNQGDLLFNRTNSAELVGKTAVYKGTPSPSSYASYLIAVRLIEGCLPDYLSYFLNSSHGRAWIASVVSQQVGQANVNGTKLQALSFPLPPLAEQKEIVAEVERRLSVTEEVEAQVEANLKRAARLRQSILKRAFEGKLVPQDPSDEPASVLLERIRQERERSSARKPKRKKPARKNPKEEQVSLFSLDED